MLNARPVEEAGMKAMYGKPTILGVFLVFLSVSGLSRAASELQQMQAIYQPPAENEILPENWQEQVSAARRFEYFGLSDPVLFDTVEANLLLSYKGSSKAEVEYTGWMAKALGFSGQEKYIDTLQTVAVEAPGKRTRGYAEKSVEILPSYTQWNRVISSKDNYRSDKSEAVNRYANMLRSGLPELQRMAAKRISFEKLFDEWLLILLDEQVRTGIARSVANAVDVDGKADSQADSRSGNDSDSDSKENSNEKVFVDAMAWMTKMLAASVQEAYRPTVELVAEQASSSKLQNYAKKYISSYY